jgi:hypothetical protein
VNEDRCWQEAMRAGDFPAAWAISDRILQERLRAGERGDSRPRHEQGVWNGQSFLGKRVLVRCYHGLGDTIQFIRYAAPLRQLASEVILWVQPELLPLAATARGIDRVLPLHDGVPEVEFDVDVEIMELPHALRIAPSQLPPEPYLFPRRATPLPHHDRTRIGIVWQAGDWDTRRSVPLEFFRSLGKAPGVTLYSLQRGSAAADAAVVPAEDISSSSVEATAATMRALDLIITVDTMAAHLAGAIGAPVWTLLHADCDWRWQRAECRCVWYRTMRLFRQGTQGDWAPPFDAMRRLLNPAAPSQKPNV